MAIDERLIKALGDVRGSVRDVQALEDLEAFYARMREAGIAKQRPYDIPQLDTVGRRVPVQELRNNAS